MDVKRTSSSLDVELYAGSWTYSTPPSAALFTCQICHWFSQFRSLPCLINHSVLHNIYASFTVRNAARYQDVYPAETALQEISQSRDAQSIGGVQLMENDIRMSCFFELLDGGCAPLVIPGC